MNIKEQQVEVFTHLLQESFNCEEDLLNKFKENAPKFYNICVQIDNLAKDTEIKPHYSIDTNNNGTFEVDFAVTLKNNSMYKGYLNSKGICKLKPTNFVLDDVTIEYLTNLNQILTQFEKHSF